MLFSKAIDPPKKSEVTGAKNIIISLPAMGGEFKYACFPQPHLSINQVHELFEEAHSEVLRIENKLTDFRPSPFQKINELAGVIPCPVDQEIFSLIKYGQLASEKSGGKFDISFASIGHPWRQARKAGRVLEGWERKKLLPWVDYRKIEQNENKQTVFLPSSSMKIGLGGLGKGYAVDRAWELLKKQGMINFSVNGSGDIRVHSHSEAPRKWRFGIRNPLSANPTQACALIELSQGGLCTSGDYVNFSLLNKDDHHIVDPQTGNSTNEIISATLLTETCLEGDVTATIMLTLSIAEGIEYLNKENLTGILIEKSGKVHLSRKALERFAGNWPRK